MIKHAMKTCLVLMVAFAMITSLMACGAVKTAPNTSSEITPETETKSNEVKKAPVKINYPTYRVGTNVGAAFEVRLLNEFKEKYKDEVELVIEELPSDQIYLDKMKILASSGDVPDLVEGKAGVGEILINANLATPLNEYLDADPQWKAEIGEDAIKANSKDGKCWSISQDRMVIGYYYNKEHFEKVGIKPAETWDEFFDNCEKLKQANITPLTLMTGEDAWTTNLLLISIVGTSGEAGNKLMNEIHATNYNTPEFIDGLKKIQYMLQNYTTSDALGAVYASAANNFLQGKTAIIANGPWMITDFSDTTKTSADFYDKVGVSIYPEGGLFSSFSAGMLLCSKDTERKDAAIKLLKFLTDAYAQKVKLETCSMIPLTPNVQPSEEIMQINPLLVDTLNLPTQAKYTYDNPDNLFFANVNDFLIELSFAQFTERYKTDWLRPAK